jgi:Fe(3+) dicitrate transport protein
MQRLASSRRYLVIALLAAPTSVRAQPADEQPPPPQAEDPPPEAADAERAPAAPNGEAAPAEPTPEAPREEAPAPDSARPPPPSAAAAADAGGPPPAADDELPPATSVAEASDASLSEVTVVGTRLSELPGSAQVIRAPLLERFEYDDPHQVLIAVPGVQIRGEDGVGLRPNIGLRGVNPDRTKKVTLMEDGVLISPAPYSAPAAYYFPLITRMTGIRVIKGPAAISFGPQTIAGAIDLATRTPPPRAAGAVDIAAGEYGYGKFHGHFGSSVGNTGFVVEGVHLRSDGFKELPSGADTGFYRNEWMFKSNTLFDLPDGSAHELELKLTYSDELSNETYLGLTDADFERDPFRRYAASQLDRMENHRTALAVTHVFEPADDITITTTAYRNDFSRVWRKVNGFRGANLFDVLTNPDDPRNAGFQSLLEGTSDSASSGEVLLIGPNDRKFAAHGIQTRVTWETDTGPISHRIEYGLRLHYDRVERRHSEQGYLLVGGELVPEATPTTVTAFNEASSDALALHASDALTWRSLTVTPGVRVEVIRSQFRDRLAGTEQGRVAQVVLPGAGAFYHLTPSLGVLAGVYRGFSPPAPGSAEHVDPELSVNYEAGARFDDRKSRAELVGFLNDYSNLTDVCTLSSGCLDTDLDRQFDAGEARVYGIEAHAQHDFPVGTLKLPVTATYTLTQSEFLTSFSSEDPIFGDVSSGDELPYVPRHQVYASAGIEHDRAGGVVGMTYVSRMREQAGQGPLAETLATDEQFLLDVGARYRPLKWLTVYANVRNLLDAHYIVSRRPFGARPNAPRWIQVGVKASF